MGACSKLQQNGGRGTQECHKKTSYLPAKPTSESSPPPPPPLFPYMGLQLINTHISRGFPDQFH